MVGSDRGDVSAPEVPEIPGRMLDISAPLCPPMFGVGVNVLQT